MARVLILEDDEAIAYVLARILTRLGHESKTVVRLPAAREALTEAPYDYFFVDLHVPGGPATLLFDDPAASLPRCILMSATGKVGIDADAAQIAESYGVPFMPKYLDHAGVEAAIARASIPKRR